MGGGSKTTVRISLITTLVCSVCVLYVILMYGILILLEYMPYVAYMNKKNNLTINSSMFLRTKANRWKKANEY